MRLDFRIDWGYQYLYSRRHYHPVFRWDGDLSCDKGKILETRQLDYPVIWYGPGHCARETLLDAPRWESSTRRGISGVRVTAEAEPNTVFELHTLSGDFSFSASDITEKGRIVFPVGPKYLGCHVIVTRTGYFWFQENRGRRYGRRMILHRSSPSGIGHGCVPHGSHRGKVSLSKPIFPPPGRISQNRSCTSLP